MAELLDDERLDDAFSQFRSAVRGEIEAPGLAATRHTVRVRRTRRTGVVIAAVAVLGLFGAAATLRTVAAGPGPGNQPGATPSSGDQHLQTLAERALQQLGLRPTSPRPGFAFGPVKSMGSTTITFGTAAEPLPAGAYYIYLACAGDGDVTVTAAVEGPPARVDIGCREQPNSHVGAPVQLLQPGTLTFNVTADAAAVGRAGMAMAITDPRQVQAEAALGPVADQSTFVLGSSGGLNDAGEMDRSEDTQLHKGNYRLSFVCVGGGTVQVHLDVAGSTANLQTACDGHPGQMLAPVFTNHTGAIIVSIDPDETAKTNEVAFAYRLVAP
jgi:hypothetical protein